jgi:glutamate-ammonia-ligase adenylyltransferase
VSYFRRLVEVGAEAGAEAALGGLSGLDGADTAGLMQGLRIARRRFALAAALADIAGVWPVDRVTGELSRFAEAVLGRAVAHLMRDAAAAGTIGLADPGDAQAGCGFTVLGLGKLGAGELNYSSDIDLILLFDPEVVDYRGRDGLQAFFARLTRRLVRILQERTADGYVFRTDLRLRPDPGATPPALPVAAAETYYESFGQNWERAAMIKARPVAGDLAVGERFLRALIPYIWRKHLDFAAIEDIHSIKRQIHAHHGGGEIAVKGHNIKLGRGGIREIEFFVQTQQLIWGGREPALRVRATCDALEALAGAGRIGEDVRRDLTEAYRFLRRVEHRLQMVDDAQTHSVPQDDRGLDAIATFLGYADAGRFAAALTGTLALVERRYGELFEEAPQLAPAGNLVFTGTEDDPETVATLERLGYRDGRAVGAVVRGWHHGRQRATRSTRAREILTELMPGLLEAFARTANPDAALLHFNEFLGRLPAGVQLFSLFHANPALLDLIAEIMGNAPRLAERLSHNAGLLDGVLSTDFDERLADADTLTAELEAALARARDYEDVLDISRRWAHDREFQAGVQMLRGDLHGDEAGAALADIADAVLRALAPRVEEEFARTHGRVPGGGLVIVGLGNLGGRELTVSSDLDLVFIYDHPEDAPEGADASDGAKPLPASHYFARLSQRLINALTALTSEGRLYEIDMRLRPSGRAGPLASSLGGFTRYQRESAWTWEHMALTRARVITGPDEMAERTRETIRGVLAATRDADRLAAEVADMRRRIDAEHHIDIPWKTKHVRGGLVDIEFVVEYLQLRHAAEHPGVLTPNTGEALTRLADAGLLAEDDAAALGDASRLMRRLRALMRLTVDGAEIEERASEGLRAALVRAGEAGSFDALRARLTAAQAAVRAIYDRLIGQPADSGKSTGESK